MKYNEYISGSEYTHVMDRLYVVLWASGNSTVYIDDISIKNNDQTTTESTTITFEGSGSYSGTNCEAGMIEKIAEPGNTSNHVIRLDSKTAADITLKLFHQMTAILLISLPQTQSTQFLSDTKC